MGQYSVCVVNGLMNGLSVALKPLLSPLALADLALALFPSL